jgi:hypothetical protein
VDHFVSARSHPAEVAARLRGFIAEHDRVRRLRCALICQLVRQNMVAGDVIGRLRKRAAEYEHDAELIRWQRRLAITKKPAPIREAA